MVTKNLSKRPATMLGCGGIKATIWKTVSNNKPFFARPFFRPFKNQSGASRN